MKVTLQGAVPGHRSARDRWSATVNSLGPYARPHRPQLISALVASVFVVAAQLVLPWPLKGLVELTLSEGQRTSWLFGLVPSAGRPAIWLTGALVSLGVICGLAEYWQRVAVARFVVPSVNDARVGILAQLVYTASPDDDAQRDPGDVLTRVVGDTARLRIGLKGVLIHLLQHGLFIIGVCAVLFALDVRLGAAYLLGLAIALVIAAWGTSRTAAMARTRRGRESRVMDRTLRAQVEPGSELVEKDPERERPVAVITQVKGLTASTVQGVLALTACSVLLLATRLAESGRLNTGDVALVSSYLLMLHYPTTRTGRQITRLGPQITSAERLARLAEPSRRRVEHR